ncbi:FG-GAP repeat domain-containing protein [Candidatus Leptofilum sp.]|uniref:FG-GAP repeat domain-containing protein n=1 Tax=Candidatus Leptofilum sp. TaxID=3241576 RepID=UPI003B5C4D75
MVHLISKNHPRFAVVLFILASLVTLIATSANKSVLAGTNTVISLGGAPIKHASPAAADFNGDGDLEIVVGGYDGRLNLLSFNGSNWNVADTVQVANALNTKLPASEHQATGRIESAPAIGDVDNDGDLEIVVTTGGFPDAQNPVDNKHGGIIVYEVSGGLSLSLKAGWPYLALDEGGQGTGGSTPDGVRDGIWSSPALGDLNGDGDLEIVTLGLDRRIYAVEHNGTAVSGWPLSRDNAPLLRGGWSSPALADIDGDGLVEIIVGTDSPPWNGDDGSGPFPSQYNSPDYTKATVWALNGDGSFVPGWPTITEQQVQSSPAVGDIDGDGDLEIVVGTGLGIGGTNGYKVYAWHHTGTAVSGWPRTTAGNMSSSPALADLNGDNVLDVIIGCGAESQQECKNLYAWQGDGSNVPGFPIQPLNGTNAQRAQPYPSVVADIDNDDQPEIIQTMASTTALRIIEHNGSQSGDLSRALLANSNTILAAPLIADVDNDGLLETVMGAENNGQAAVYIFEETGANDNDSLPWPTFQQNMARTGIFEPPRLAFTDELRFYHQQGTGNTAVLQTAIHNSGGDEIDWILNESIAELTVSSTSGTVSDSTQLTFTVTTDSFAQNQWHNLGTITITGTNNGVPVQGSPQTATVYLYVGDIANIYLPMITK